MNVLYKAASDEAEAKYPLAIRSSSGKYADEFSPAAVSLSSDQLASVQQDTRGVQQQ